MSQREFDIILGYILMVCNPIAIILLFWLMIFYRIKVQRVEQKIQGVINNAINVSQKVRVFFFTGDCSDS